MPHFAETGLNPAEIFQKSTISEESEAYILDESQLLALRVELSAINAEKQHEVEEFASQAVDVIVAKYELNPSLEDRKVTKRIIVTNDQLLKEFVDVWVENNFGEMRCVGDYEEKYGKFIVVSEDPNSNWNELTSDERQKLIERHSSEEAARLYVQELFLANAIIHELIHHFQEEKLYQYEEFIEGGATYIEVETAKALGIQPLSATQVRDEYQAFVAILSKYGDLAVKVLFGQEQDATRINQLISEFNDFHARLS